jgi:hypothetical protein
LEPLAATAAAVPPRADPETTVSRRTALAGLVLAGAGLAGVASILAFRRERQPERAVLNGSVLTALDGLGRPIWAHRFPKPVREPDPDDVPWRIQVLDLHGSGERGVLVACSFRDEGVTPSWSAHELLYFSHAGKLEWSLPCRPELLDRNGRPFEPDWSYSSIVATPSGHGQVLWAGVKHGVRFPGCILRIGPDGASRLQFANAGCVEDLCVVRRPEGEFIAFSAENNAFDRACVGMLGTGDPPATSPAGGAERYRFANAPGGLPRGYVLLPNTELTVAAGCPYGRAWGVRRSGPVITVDLRPAVDCGQPSANLIYELSEDLAPVSVTPGGSCPSLHRQLEERGILNHPWSRCPELAKPLTLRRFRRGAGWAEQQVPWRLPTNTL